MKSSVKVLILLAGLLRILATSSLIDAQSLIDSGETEPYHPSFVSYRLGAFYQLRGDHERAIAEFTQSIEVLPTFGYAYAARGDSYAAIGAYDLAISDYTSAVTIFPDFVSALYMRGRAYVAVGEVAFAIVDYANAIGQMPEYPLPYWGMGDALFQQEKYEPALKYYRRYLSLVEGRVADEIVGRVKRLFPMAAGGDVSSG